MSTSTKVTKFLSAANFAVVGCSRDRSKFGNKVLRCYLEHNKHAIPINPKEESIEELPCVTSLSSLPANVLSDLSVSVITPPKVTVGVLEEAAKLGIRRIWLQPGCDDAAVRATAEKVGLMPELLYGGPCGLVELGVKGEN